MKTAILFIDDDATILDAISPNIRLAVRGRVTTVRDLQSVAEVQDYLSSADVAVPVLAIVDLWLNDFETNTADQEGGAKVIDLLRKKYEKLRLIVFSAHLNRARKQELRDAYAGIAILGKGDGSLDRLLAEIDRALSEQGL